MDEPKLQIANPNEPFLMREYEFKANAREVRDFFLRGAQEKNVFRFIESDGNFFILAELLLDSAFAFYNVPHVRNTVYGGIIMARVGKGDGRTFAEFKKGVWLIEKRLEICQICISQEEEGKCKGFFYLTNFERWNSDEIFASGAGPFCASFVKYFVSETIEGWEGRRSASDEPTAKQNFPETVVHRLDDMHSDLSQKLDEITVSQRNIYKRIDADAQATIDAILKEFREHSVSQADMERTLDAIRRALKYALNEGSLTNDPTIKQSLLKISQTVNSNSSFEQQFELSIPIIPFLLQYKVLVGAGVELDAVWKELHERVQKKSN